MRLRWTPEAAENLESIYDYLIENHPIFAVSTIQNLYEAARSLRSHSERGRPGIIPDTRELVLQKLPYVIIYRITAPVVEVLHIYHGAQER